ncbi:MAG: 5'/3'-nucleotidase SurE [Clostridia bacterium]|nr:5'/3'-nucleotidase SurE [Clostridia bacterium]
MRVLLTNDDGILAPGIRALGEVFRAAGHRVFVCAPDRERSAASHSGTFNRALRAREADFPGAERAWAVDGTPADCASLGLFLTRDAGVDVVISGINRGMNQGGACVYSGTVGAAMEAAMCGTQALAVSLCVAHAHGEDREDYAPAARAALRVAEWMPAHPLPRGVIYNLNVPTLPYEQIRGIAAARLAEVFLDDPDYTLTEDGWSYCGAPRRIDLTGTDVGLTRAGFASLTKLTWDFRLNAEDCELNTVLLN